MAAQSVDPKTATKYHHGDLAQALVDEALAQVRRQGTESVSLRGVTQALGVTASAAYHHFPDKTALLEAVSQRGSDELDRRCTHAVAAVSGSPISAAWAKVAAIGQAYIRFALDEPQLFRHTFGAYCEAPKSHGDLQRSAAYVALGDVLDELATLDQLRFRSGLELLAWSSVHGFACLAIDGLVAPPEGPLLGETIARLLAK